MTVRSIAAGQEPPLPETVEFNRDIRPILSDKCFACHGPDQQQRQADLRLDVADGPFAPRDGGPAIIPGEAQQSVLYQRITDSDPDLRMPPVEFRKTLTEREIELIKRWIEQDATWQSHWAFLPPKKADPPQLDGDTASRSAIDRFILRRLRIAGLEPADEADRRTLVRRLSFDLCGLPPEPELVERALSDTGGAWYENVVEQFLQSPHFGERMAIVWLDLVRYADSVGYHGDQEVSVSPFRDYVIHAFNDDMPFDQFTREQLGGDLLSDATLWQKVASGYNRLGMMSAEGGVQPKEYLAKYAAERVRTTSTVWLGVTLGCAECHDHKFDPFTTKDFYRFASFFADIKEQGIYAGANKDGRWGTQIDVPDDNLTALLQPIDMQIAALQKTLEQPAGELDATRKQLEELTAQREQLRQRHTRTSLVTVSIPPREMRVLPRGNWMDDSGPVVDPAIPEFLGSVTVADRADRLELANWLVSADNPLTARVFVNRLWKMLFGTGLYKTLDDIGSQGDLPSHPELIDWLAVEFLESGWNVKHMIRLMVNTTTYRRSSVPSPAQLQADPYNRLLARQSRWRLEAEMIRDNALAVSGLLVPTIGGVSARPYQPDGYYAHLNFPARTYHHDTNENQYRRGVYTHWQRQFLHPAMKAFDAPPREECAANRPRSNTPLAALVLLNDPSYVESARALATNMMTETGNASPTTARIDWLIRRVLTRTPQPEEATILSDLYEQHRADYATHPNDAGRLIQTGLAPVPDSVDPVELAAWTSVARVILNLHETISRN